MLSKPHGSCSCCRRKKRKEENNNFLKTEGETDSAAFRCRQLSELRCWCDAWCDTNAPIVKVSLPASFITEQTHTHTHRTGAACCSQTCHANNMAEPAALKQTGRQQAHVLLLRETQSFHPSVSCNIRLNSDKVDVQTAQINYRKVKQPQKILWFLISNWSYLWNPQLSA